MYTEDIVWQDLPCLSLGTTLDMMLRSGGNIIAWNPSTVATGGEKSHDHYYLPLHTSGVYVATTQA